MAPSLVVLAAGMARRYGGCKPLAPVGPNGEAVIDLVASDAIAAGFGDLVLVLHPDTGPAIRYHVERCWPASLTVGFVEQPVPLGTTHAVLAARPALDPAHPFAVANADDVYGEPAMSLLAGHLDTQVDEHALVCFPLQSTVVTDNPVTRGVCRIDADGHLVSIAERRHVSRVDDGHHFDALDGGQPDTLPGDAPVSVNLWGFHAAIWEVLCSAMDASGLAGPVRSATGNPTAVDQATGDPSGTSEVLLPEVVGSMVASGTGLPVRALRSDSRCIGVTHAGDLPMVRAELNRQVARGLRPDRLWTG